MDALDTPVSDWKVEAALVLVAALLCGGLAASWPDGIPSQLSVGGLMLVCSVLLLGQGLLRDLHTLWKQRRASAPPATKMVCMCVESTVGMLGVVSGALALLGGLGGSVALGPLAWTALVALVGAAGLLIRDWVFDVGSRSVRRVKNHGRIQVW